MLAVKLRRDRIIVILRDRIYVYRFSDLEMMDCVGTGRNEAGLCAISLEGATGTTGGGTINAGAGNGSGDGDNSVMVLACPGVVTGQVRLELYGLRKTSVSSRYVADGMVYYFLYSISLPFQRHYLLPRLFSSSTHMSRLWQLCKLQMTAPYSSQQANGAPFYDSSKLAS